MADHRAQPQGEWVLERCANRRFPYRLPVFRADKLWFTLRVQDRWPTANRNIFAALWKQRAAAAASLVAERQAPWDLDA